MFLFKQVPLWTMHCALKSGKMKLKIKDCGIMKVEVEEIKSISFLLKTTQLLHLTLHVHPEVESLTIALIRAFSSIAWQYWGGNLSVDLGGGGGSRGFYMLFVELTFSYFLVRLRKKNRQLFNTHLRRHSSLPAMLLTGVAQLTNQQARWVILLSLCQSDYWSTWLLQRKESNSIQRKLVLSF